MAQTPEFKYAPMFQVGKDETEYRLLTKESIERGVDASGPAGVPRRGVHAAQGAQPPSGRYIERPGGERER